MGLLFIIESILCLESLLEMLMVYSFARQEAYDRGDLVVEQREEWSNPRDFLIQCRVNNNMLTPIFSYLIL